jgi:serine/threonine protein kinase
VLLLQSLHMLCGPKRYGLHRGTPEFEHAAQELLQEARLLQSLRHDNIVTMRGVTMHPEHGHVQWLVTERADGGSLEAWLSARGVLTLAELVDLLRSVMRALVYLHSRTPSVIHRNVKPANVLVFTTLGGGVAWKLADVGITKALQTSSRGHSVPGTPMYMAPDVLVGAYDGKVDVFSVGIMAAELVVRHMDIEGFERVGAGVYCQPEHRAALVDDACARLDRVSPALSSVVRGCSAIKAKHRMSSDDVLRALEAVTMPVVRESDSASVVVVAFTSVAFTVL